MDHNTSTKQSKIKGLINKFHLPKKSTGTTKPFIAPPGSVNNNATVPIMQKTDTIIQTSNIVRAETDPDLLLAQVAADFFSKDSLIRMDINNQITSGLNKNMYI